MACDIHLYIEKKCYKYNDEEKKNGVWVLKNEVEIDEYAFKYPEEGETQIKIKSEDIGRDYSLFSILAEVRTSSLIGIVSGDFEENKTHFEPKGFPEDACSLTRQEFEDWGADAHTPSYLSLKELESYFLDKNNKVNFHGKIFNDQYREFLKTKKEGKPNYDLLYPHCAATTAENYVYFSEVTA